MPEVYDQREDQSVRTVANCPVGSRPLPVTSKTGTRCPRCRSEQVRSSTTLSLTERLMELFGRATLRCDSCYHRFPHWTPK